MQKLYESGIHTQEKNNSFSFQQEFHNPLLSAFWFTMIDCHLTFMSQKVHIPSRMYLKFDILYL